jgi:hypothetical protein
LRIGCLVGVNPRAWRVGKGAGGWKNGLARRGLDWRGLLRLKRVRQKSEPENRCTPQNQRTKTHAVTRPEIENCQRWHPGNRHCVSLIRRLRARIYFCRLILEPGWTPGKGMLVQTAQPHLFDATWRLAD